MTSVLETSSGTRSPGSRLNAAALAAALVVVAVAGGALLFERQQRSMFSRYDTSFGHGCLADTAWGTVGVTATHGSTAASVEGAGGGRPARLSVTGTSDGAAFPVLMFTARSALGSGRLSPADPATARVLADHYCPT